MKGFSILDVVSTNINTSYYYVDLKPILYLYPILTLKQMNVTKWLIAHAVCPGTLYDSIFI